MGIAETYAYKNFLTGATLASATGTILMIVSFALGRDNFFLLLNKDFYTPADYFFRFCTNLGDGVIWAVVLIYFIMHRKKSLPLLIAAIVLSTVLTQFAKMYIFPAYLRPTAAITDLQSIHTVFGVELLRAHSFPSGHTATATSIYLIGCLLTPRKWIILVGFLYALLVGYSRIYLGQHYPIDVGGGMIAGVVTILLSIAVQKWWDKRSAKNIEEVKRE